MIYCVVPQALADELFDKLVEYYKDDPNVKVIVDRRAGHGRRARRRTPRTRDRRRRRVEGRRSAHRRPATSERLSRRRRQGRRPRGRRRARQPRARRPWPPWPPRRRRRCSAERNAYIGEATNNVAEYRAVLLGLELARELGASEVEVVNDSELVARQIGGEYKVKHAGLKPLYPETMSALREFDPWSVRNVRREQNERADELVNEALDEASRH